MSTDVHTLSGAYALDALGPEEAAEFRRHLETCQACRDEVRELQRAVSQLGEAEAQPPPAELKGRILAAADRTPQQPPRVVRHASGRPPRRWVGWVAAAAAAVVLVGGGALGVRALLDDDPVLSPALPPAVSQVFEADDARTKALPTENGGTLVVGVAPSRNEMAVDTRELPELDADHVYQLWAQVGAGMTSVGVLTDPDAGAAMEMPEEGVVVAVTVEPVGGSEQPTTDPIAEVEPADL